MLDFTDLPLLARVYITTKAARRFAAHTMGDEATVKYTEDDEMRARYLFVTDELRRADHNMLRDSRSTARVVNRRRR